jgi:hypothetical protein
MKHLLLLSVNNLSKEISHILIIRTLAIHTWYYPSLAKLPITTNKNPSKVNLKSP